MKKLICLLLCGILFSCSQNEFDPDRKPLEPQFFELNKSNYYSTSETTEFTLKISTNTNWSIKTKPDWIEASVMSGSENVDLKFTVLENPNGKSRSANLEIEAMDELYVINFFQEGFPIELLSYTSSDTPIQFTEKKYFLFNKPISLVSITSGDGSNGFHVRPDEVEYFNNDHGVKFTEAPLHIGRNHNIRVEVKDEEGNKFIKKVNFKYYYERIYFPGRAHKMIMDNEDNLWVLTIRRIDQDEVSRIYKFVRSNDSYIEDLRFEIDLDYRSISYTSADFFINPHNNLIYVPDFAEEEIDVYTKTGDFVEHINIPHDESDYPGKPTNCPVSVGFNNAGKGIVCLQQKNGSGRKWRFIDSSDNHMITIPDDSHKYYSQDLERFTLNRDQSKLYVIGDTPYIIKILNGNNAFEEIDIYNAYESGANTHAITQNRLNDKIFASGLKNQQIISPDLSYLSKQSNFQGLVGEFSYDEALPNHIYALDGGYDLMLLDYDNEKIKLDYLLFGHFGVSYRRGLATTPDNRFVILFSEESPEPYHSQIVLFTTEMLY